ncbi:MAG TPA: N-6 DNA methylase, partial [Longimicrobiales bacterium]
MRNIAENIFSRSGIIAFANAIGFTDEPCALPANGTPPVTHLGKRGSSRCIHIRITEFDVANLNRTARQLRTHFAAESLLLLITSGDYARVCVACFNADDLCTLMLERGRIHNADVDALSELVPRNGEVGLHLAMRHARALDRVRVTNRFFNDFRAHRARVADAWEGIGPRLREEREQLALLLLSRLMFLYFLQRRGFLGGNREFFLDRLRAHFTKPAGASFYRSVLRPLFFGVLNRRPEKRTQRAAALGALPYLNGGLFERHYLERRYPDLNLGDSVIRGVFEQLLERYRFTAAEGEHDLAVDPEMLGRVFEGLMADNARHCTGTFYTPASVVRRMVRSAFDAYLGAYPIHQASRLLREARVLDPACGSGAFLLGALDHISSRRSAIEGIRAAAIRAEVVARNLHGVDLQQDAALLCALRLWLALIPDEPASVVRPLPNLDRRIRQGDALTDPLDLAAEAVASPAVRAARRTLQPLVQRYTQCDPEERPGVHRLVARRERDLSRAWLDALHMRAREQTRELRAQAAARDLFGAVPSSALEARAQ